MSIQSQQTVADMVLSQIQILDPAAIIAGGAPRDWHLDREASDVDVFMHMPRTVQNQGGLRKSLGVLLAEEVKILSREETPEYAMNPNILDVYQIDFDYLKVQVIRSLLPTYRTLEGFPLSLSKVWYKNGIIRPTREFVVSVENNVIWKTLDSYPREHKYIQKIRSKFPGWRYFDSELAFLRSKVGL